jgi:hypothetical protein
MNKWGTIQSRKGRKGDEQRAHTNVTVDDAMKTSCECENRRKTSFRKGHTIRSNANVRLERFCMGKIQINFRDLLNITIPKLYFRAF